VQTNAQRVRMPAATPELRGDTGTRAHPAGVSGCHDGRLATTNSASASVSGRSASNRFGSRRHVVSIGRPLLAALRTPTHRRDIDIADPQPSTSLTAAPATASTTDQRCARSELLAAPRFLSRQSARTAASRPAAATDFACRVASSPERSPPNVIGGRPYRLGFAPLVTHLRKRTSSNPANRD